MNEQHRQHLVESVATLRTSLQETIGQLEEADQEVLNALLGKVTALTLAHNDALQSILSEIGAAPAVR